MEVDSPVLLVPLPAPDAFILFCVALLVEGFANGGPRPAVAQPKGGYRRCKRYWWTNMLYVNNLVPFKDTFTEQCFGHAWYLGNDMQFFIILPLFIVAYTFNRRAGYASLFVGFWASIIYSLWGAGHFHWSLPELAAPPTSKHTITCGPGRASHPTLLVRQRLFS